MQIYIYYVTATAMPTYTEGAISFFFNKGTKDN